MRARGFTLLELLVAITVLSVVSVIAWRGLDTLVTTRDRLEPEVDETRAMLVAFGQMERDLSQLVNPAFLGLLTSPVNIRTADGAALIEIARVAAAAPDRPTEVQTVYYRVIEGTLVRQSSPALPSFQHPAADQFENARLLTGMQSMDVRLWQPGTGWIPASDRFDAAPPVPGAPPAAGRPLVPPGVEVILTRADGRTYRRVFVVGA